MQPHVLLERLTAYNAPAKLHLLVLDFLTNRQQYIRTQFELSSIITVNTGIPQECVLSAFLAPLTRRSAQRSWWYYWFVRRRRPSVNFCFKSLLLLQFLFDNSEFFTVETRHIVPPCNKAGISNFCLELQKLQKFQISWKRYSSYSSHSIILKFLLEKLRI